MPVLTITKTYADGDTLFEADLDNIKDDLENFLNVTKLNDDNIQNSGITASTKLVDATVTSAKIASAAITTSKIADDSVTTAKIIDANVTTAKLTDSSITTAKIADGAVTQAKRAALGQQISSSCGNFTTTSLSAVDVTNLSVSITTTGRPVMVFLTGDGVGGTARWGSETGAGFTNLASHNSMISLVRDSTTLNSYSITGSVSSSSQVYTDFTLYIPSSSISAIDVPAAGTYTYKVQLRTQVSGGTAAIRDTRLVALEL